MQMLGQGGELAFLLKLLYLYLWSRFAK